MDIEIPTKSPLDCEDESPLFSGELLVVSASDPGFVPSLNEKGQAFVERLARCSTAAARRHVPYDQALRLCALPLGVFEYGGERTLSVLTPAVDDPAVLRALTFLSGSVVEASYAPAEEVQAALFLAYLGDPMRLEQSVGNANRSVASTRVGTDGRLGDISVAAPPPQAPIPNLLEATVHRALYLGASDIHMESTEQGMRIRFRVDGRLQPDTALTIEAAAASNLVRRIKVLSKLEFSAECAHVEGAFSLTAGTDEVRLRVSVLGQALGPKIVLRIVRRGVRNQFVKTDGESLFSALGLGTEEERALCSHLESGRGVVLVAGPTGSGKSTLLYASLEYLNEDWRNLITLEDPVERIISGVNQIQIARERYGEMLPLLLRQDPDVVMVGEIRDQTTAEAALTAGISGQLVLSTVHAGTTFEVLARLRTLGAEPQLILSSLSLIISQRLLPKNCERCRIREDNEGNYSESGALHGAAFWRARGCSECAGSGIRGRCGVFELLPMTDSLRAYLSRSPTCDPSIGSPNGSLGDVLAASGFIPMSKGVQRRLLSGDVSIETLRSIGRFA